MTDTAEEMRSKIQNDLFDKIIQELTKERAAPRKATAESISKYDPQEIVTRGTLDEINLFYQKQGWSDQIPIIPPTIEKVKRFLLFTPRRPDEVIAVLPQANIEATPWNIAVNGIMAGCRPEYMPVLIAGVEAMGVPSYNLGQFGTTWALYPFFAINGPTIKQIGIEYGQGLISRGANTALGRAFGLIMRNLAGFRPGEMWMGTWGHNPPPVIAEDEDYLANNIGWKPYHVELGFDENASTVTACGTWSWGDQMTISQVGGVKKGEDLLKIIAFDLGRKVSPAQALKGGPLGYGMAAVLISPPCARFIRSDGYSRQDVIDYLYANTKRTLDEWLKWWMNAGATRDFAFARLEQYVREGTLPKYVLTNSTGKTIPIVSKKEQIKVFVCGDRSKDKIQNLYGWYPIPSTKRIELPGNWDSLLKSNTTRSR